jgi:hypothetical protein
LSSIPLLENMAFNATFSAWNCTHVSMVDAFLALLYASCGGSPLLRPMLRHAENFRFVPTEELVFLSLAIGFGLFGPLHSL